MTLHVTGKFCRRARLAALAGSFTLVAMPVTAQDDVTDPTPSVRDVAMTPLTDLNLSKDPIPAVLVEARTAPYGKDGIRDCMDIRREVGDLDAVLGDDFDTAPPDDRDLTPTGVAQKVVGFFIPFRGIIREISGANAHEYEFREAIAAGLMRRAYLKGMGEQMDCPYPASPATPAMMARLEQEKQIRSGEYSEQVMATADDGTTFVSRPVIQGAD